MSSNDAAIDWLLRSDPAIRWQAMRDLTGVPQSQWTSERAKVETEGWGAKLLSLQDADGRWAGGTFLPAGFGPDDWKREGQPWTATCFSVGLLRDFGLDPGCLSARRMVALVGRNARWEEGGQPYWDGEVEECINGRTVAQGAYFGLDMTPVVNRLLGEQLADGGWNCERANGSVRSSYHTTINVLEGLLDYERNGGSVDGLRAVRRAGEEYLLQRHLFRRLSTGAVANSQFLSLLQPHFWRYDILRALDYFRAAGLLDALRPDPRLAEAIELIRSRRRNDGTWPLDWRLKGRVWFNADDGEGEPSAWVTLRALRVLKWWDEGTRVSGA